MVLGLREEFRNNSDFYKRMMKRYDEIAETERIIKRKKFRSVIDRYKPPSKREGAFLLDDKKCKGDFLLDTIYSMLNKLYRSPQQKKFHKSFLASFLRIIYGDEYESEKHRVCKKYGFESRKQQVLICAPRRIGKTWAVAYLVVVASIVLSGTEISIFSPGKRQSVALMTHIYNFFKKLNETDRILKRNDEQIIVRTLGLDESKINGYPSAVKTLKGVSGTIVILEEMAVMDPRVLFEVVVPLHQIEITSIIGISTITDSFNMMTKFLDKKDKNGENLFAVQHIYLACEKCRAEKVAASCNHNAYLLPNWSSSRKRKIINCIMEDNKELLEQEIGGIASSLYDRAFPSNFVEDMQRRRPFFANHMYSYPHIFIAIDPNGAGRASDFAITTMIRVNGNFVIIGMESFTSRSAEENFSLIYRHLCEIDKNELFRNALKVFIIESNLGLESDHIKSFLDRKGIRKYLVMSESEKEGAKVGFRTTNAMKTSAVEQVREKLIDGSLNLIDDKQLICVSQTIHTIKSMLFTQLMDFSQVLKEQDFDKPRKYWSGKASGKDDLVMTVLFAVYWSKFLYTRYSNFI